MLALTISAFNPDAPGACPSGTITSLQDADAGPRHNGPGIATVTVCCCCVLLSVESTTFICHSLVVIRRTTLIHRE